MSDTVTAPFSPDMVASLNGFQRSGVMHEFTCGIGGGTHPPLVARVDGWYCEEPGCDYTQDWAHRWMADHSWKQYRDKLRELGFHL